MRSTCLAALLWAVVLDGVVALDAASWISRTDRRDNPVVLSYILSGDLAQALEAASALGHRPDPYVADILVALARSGSPGGAEGTRSQLVQLWILQALLPREAPRQELRARVLLNVEALDVLVPALPRLMPLLRRDLLRMLAWAPQPRFGAALMQEAAAQARRLAGSRGRMTAGQAEVVLALLDAVEALGEPTLAEPVALIAGRAASLPVASRAASVAGALLDR